MSEMKGVYAGDPLLEAAKLGLKAENFIQRDSLGKYLVERAHQSRIQALEGLAACDPTDVEAVRKLQWKAMIPDLFHSWLREAIADGISAEESIKVIDNS